ncbi:MAG: 50S ribosomal protein L25 [Nitrospinota bacterium]|nr:50S ribosomal protein L25 [Nitrospinota bacterium]
MDIVELKVEKRTDKGKKASRTLRKKGLMPAIIYGGGLKEKLAVSSKEVFRALSGASGKSVILKLGLDGGTSWHALLQELQYHPLNDTIFHADFLQIDIKKPLVKSVPVIFKGVAMGVKIKGGILRVHHDKITLEGIPESMPVSVEVNISELDIDQKLTISTISLPEGIKALDSGDTPLVSIAPPKQGPGGKEGDTANAEGAKAAAPAAGAKAAGGEEKKK